MTAVRKTLRDIDVSTHLPTLVALCFSLTACLSNALAGPASNSAAKTSKTVTSHSAAGAERLNRYTRGLGAALKLYEQIHAQGSWPQLANLETARPGDAGPRIGLLRERLRRSGDLRSDAPQGDTFDAELGETLRRFQMRHGLEPDGVAGKATLAALNVSVEQRIRQIKVNLHRWSQMPPSLGARYVLVNLAGFELDVIEGDRPILEMKVVVGKNYRQTPSFSDAISYLELNPSWTVPPSIANKDLVHKFAANPGYAQSNGFRALKDGREFDVSSIDWNSQKGRPLPYTLKQNPGPRNALGTMKFMFPNKYSVYLHDTNSRGLFDKTVRTFSSGCIRVEKPGDLASLLLRNDPTWSAAKLQDVVSSGKTTRINIKPNVPVHLVYMTAWVNRHGVMQFRPDIYGRDNVMMKQLFGG